MTPDEARAAVQPLYHAARYRFEHEGEGPTLPIAEREALWKRAAELERAAYAKPRLTPRKREPDTYCFRCGAPVPGGLFVCNTRAGGRTVSLVNVDRWNAELDQVEPHCGAAPASAPQLAPPVQTPAFVAADGAQLRLFDAAPAIACPTCGARRVYSDGIDDPTADRRGYVCDNCARAWSVDGAQLDLFADPVSAPAMRAEDL